MNTTPTSGAAIQRYKIGYRSYEWGQRSSTPSGIPDASGSWVRYADHIAALAAGQATAAPENIRGILARCRDFIDTTKAPAYPAGADLADEIDVLLAAQPAPQPSHVAQAVVQDDLITIRKPTTSAEMLWLLKLAHLVISDVDKTLEETFAPAQAAAPQGVAYAALPNEREMLKHALWLASSFTVHRYLISNAEGRWSGAEKATCHDELCRLYVAAFRGAEVDRVRVDFEADWVAVHDATQELTDNMDVAIGFPLKGVPDYESLAPKFFAHFHRLATHALRASHGQAPASKIEGLTAAQESLGVEFERVLHDNLFDLYEESPQTAAHGQAPATQQAGEVRRAELVPGVMHCAKCKFQLNRVTLCVSDGNAYAGNNKTEPCPNGCGPLWPVTWEQEAKNCWKALEEMHERLMAAAAPQPSPTAQAASSAVLKAIREANMQLVRTGDNAFMLVPYKVATAQAADSVPAQVLVAALIAAKQAINSMKAEAETAAQGDEQMMLEACETISNEGLQADIAIRAALASAQQPAPSAAVLDYPHARRFGGCPACGRSDCVAMSCTRTTSDDLLHIAARKQGGKHDNH